MSESWDGCEVIHIAQPGAMVEISAPLAHVKISGPSCVVDVTGTGMWCSEDLVKDLELQVEHLNGELVERDQQIDKLAKALDAIDDHGRALSFVETLKEKDQVCNNLRSENEELKETINILRIRADISKEMA